MFQIRHIEQILFKTPFKIALLCTKRTQPSSRHLMFTPQHKNTGQAEQYLSAIWPNVSVVWYHLLSGLSSNDSEGIKKHANYYNALFKALAKKVDTQPHYSLL